MKNQDQASNEIIEAQDGEPTPCLCGVCTAAQLEKLQRVGVQAVAVLKGAGLTSTAGALKDALEDAPVIRPHVISYEDYWDVQIKMLMQEIGLPESNTVYAAMKRFQMRIEQYEALL